MSTFLDDDDDDDDYDYSFEALDDDYEEPVVFHVLTSSYCGMTIPHDTFDDFDDAIDCLEAEVKRLTAAGFECVPLDNMSYEVLEPEDCQMVPDCCGFLGVRTAPASQRYRYG